MRAIHLSDLHVAACALRVAPNTMDIAQTIAAAHTADRYRKRLRKAHPTYGTGTLSSAIGPIQEPTYCDRAYLEAMQAVVTALLQRAGP